MRTGISTACLYPTLVEKSLKHLLSMDFKVFEIFINTFSELQPPFLHSIQHMLRESGAEVKSLHPFTSGIEGMLFFSEYSRRIEDGLEFYKSYFDAANELGAKLLVLHGQRGYQTGKITEEEYIERYLRLFRLGKSFGITVAQENVNLFRSEEASFLQSMREQTNGECAFVFDIKQAVRAKQDPFAVCRAMGDRLVHVHINDHKAGADCLLPGSGEMDYAQLLRQLRSVSYDGDLIIEVYRSNFSQDSELLQAKSFVESLCTGTYV